MSPIQARTCIVLAIGLLSGCATAPDGKPMGLEKSFKATFASEDPCSKNARNTGIAVGALMGTIAAKVMGGNNNESLLVGAGVGALVGGLIGADMDRRRCEISKVAKAHNLDIVMSDINIGSTTAAAAPAAGTTAAAPKPELAGMSLTIIDHGQQFATGSAKPSNASVQAFGDVADQYHVLAADKQEKSVQAAQARNKQMRILLIGHTDDTGSSALNADLSEGRAQAIAEIFAKRGFSKDQIFYQGAGEVFPVASNSTEEGRARNRRVEIVDLSDDKAFAAFLESRRPNVALYRPAAEPGARTEMGSSAPAATTKAAETKKSSKTGNVAVAAATPFTTGSKPSTVAALSKPVPAAADTGNTTKAQVLAKASNKADTLAAAPAVAAKPRPVSALANLDLGGKPANGQFRVADIGKTERASSFSIISAAYASDESPVGSCATDRPRISRGVKSLGTGKVFKTSEYLPGTATASWGGKVNGHMVGMSNVSVLRDGGQPASRPDFYIWKDHVDGAKTPPDLKTNPEVNAYLGDKALLYRVFLAEGPVRCLDLVIPTGAAGTAPNSNIVYEHNSALYQADFSPTIIR
jgi:outer membrane protein OmpA-like peptidoglycan-associated protein